MAATSTDDKVWGIEMMFTKSSNDSPRDLSVTDELARTIPLLVKQIPDHAEEFRVIVHIRDGALAEVRSS